MAAVSGKRGHVDRGYVDMGETGGAVLGGGRRLYRRSESDPGQGGSGFRKARSRGHGYVDTGETGGLSWVRGGGSIEEVGVTQDRGGSGFSKSEVTWTVVTWTQVKPAGCHGWRAEVYIEEVGVTKDRGGGVKKGVV